MIKARTSDGQFIFGLDANNIRLLKEGKPIKIDLRLMDGVDQFTIMYGETLAEITAELEKHFGKLPMANPWPDIQ